MKSLKIFLLTVCAGAFSLCAADPYLHFPLNEGDLKQVKEATGKIKKITVWNENQFSWSEGPDGKALNFNTPDNLKTYAGLMFNMPKEFDPAKGFTFTALVKMPKELHRSRQYQIFFWSNNHTRGPGFRIYISWKALYVMAGEGNAKTRVVISSKNAQGSLQADSWYHVAVSCSGTQVKLYIDGKLRGTATCTLKKSTRRWAAIGASSQGGSASGFNGIISDVRIFDKVLSDTEIAEIEPEK